MTSHISTHTRKLRAKAFLGLFLLATTCLGQEISDQDYDIIGSFYDQALTRQQSYEWLEDLCAIGPRLSGSAASLSAIQWTKLVMDTCGFDTVYLQPVKVPHWERGKQERAIVSEHNGKMHSLSVLAIGGSVPTPPGGIEAQVLEVESLLDLESYTADQVAGKIVFYNPTFDQTNISPGASYGANVGTRVQGAIRAAEKGAVASIIRSVTSAKDDVPHTGTGAYSEDHDSIPAAALGVQSADLLHEILTKDPEAKLYLEVHSRWHPDAQSYNVVGEKIGSTYPEEIIVVGGHLDSWDVGDGAHDDGAGCMQSIGAIKLLLGKSVQPKRTLRAVMFINEENGTRGGLKYAEDAIRLDDKHILAIESDAGAFSPRGYGFTGSESQLQKLRSWLPAFPRNTIGYINKGGGGVDIGPLHRQTGAPMMGLIVDGQRMFDLHHSANDVIGSVHPREMELGTASLATMIYLVDRYGL